MLSSRTRKVVNRAATTLRLAAMLLGKTSTPLGSFYRRKRAQFGAPKAISATARKLGGSVATLQGSSDKLGRYGPRTLSCRSIQMAPIRTGSHPACGRVVPAFFTVLPRRRGTLGRTRDKAVVELKREKLAAESSGRHRIQQNNHTVPV